MNDIIVPDLPSSLPKEWSLYDVGFEKGEFIVRLHSDFDADECWIVRFCCRIYGYQVFDEGERLRTWDVLRDALECPQCANIYLLRKSCFLDWFHRETYGIYENQKPQHYFIISSGLCVDVLASEGPEIGRL